MAIFISFDSFNIGYFIQPCNIPCSMQHVVLTPLTCPGSCKSCFSHIPVFGRKISLIFPIIYQIAHLHNWPTWPSYPFDLCWQLSWMTCLAGSEGILRLFPQLALKFHWDKTCLYFELLFTLLRQNMLVFWASFYPFDIQITLKLFDQSISHAKTNLLDDCAGGSQGVQLLDWSNMGQVQAIRLRWVWVTWHPSIWCWSLWVG